VNFIGFDKGGPQRYRKQLVMCERITNTILRLIIQKELPLNSKWYDGYTIWTMCDTVRQGFAESLPQINNQKK
jgi:hypothetical protein